MKHLKVILIIVFGILISIFLKVFLASLIYPGFGVQCKCVGYSYDVAFDGHINIVDPETLKPLVTGQTAYTTVCYGIRYQCKQTDSFVVHN